MIGQIERILHFTCPCLLVVFAFGADSLAQSPTEQQPQSWYARKTSWHGHDRYHFEVAGRSAYLVAPRQAADGKPWVWRARFPDYHWEMDVALLSRGFHVAYVDVAGLFGSPKAVEIGDALYRRLTTRHGLAPKPCLEGVSRGGLFVYNWAAKHPNSVACIYCDTPVLDIKSWPGGKGAGLGSESAWQECLQAYDMTEQQAELYRQNPVDHAKVIAEANIPILHVVSENDHVVPPKENTYLLQRRLQECGHSLQVISVPVGTQKSNGHHFEHPEPDRVVQFITRYAANP